MSTRGVMILRKDGVEKAMHILHDAYPEGAGIDIVDLIKTTDSGMLFDLTESDVQVGDLSSFILSGLMEAHREKAYLVTTGYNRNMIRFSQK